MTAPFKITGKLKLPAETASKALQISASGEVESSAVSNTELGYLSGVTSAIQTQIGNKANASDLTSHTSNTSNPHSVTKAQVGLGNVPNVDATNRANHTGTQLAATISDFSSAAKSAAVADSIADAVTDVAPSQNAVFDALALKINTSEKGANSGVATLDAGGKVPASQLPNSVMTYEGTFDASATPATPLLNGDSAANAGMVYLASVAGSYNFGAGAISFAVGDWAVYSGSIWEKSINSNTVVSVNGQTGVVTLTKSDVSLGNVDNTSDATKNSATATLTNKTIDASSNTISNLTVAMLASGVLDTDLSSVSASDDTLPSAKAVKAYADSLIGSSSTLGDISHTSFSASNNVTSVANVTGLAFSSSVVRSFKAQVSVAINATASLYETFELMGIQTGTGFVMSVNGVGDDSGVVFSITSGGQVQYTSANSAGFVSNTIKFRATVTNI
jgi:hypothetical protein